MKFADLGLSPPIMSAIAATGYETPTPIQAQAIPVVLAGRDLMAAAQTGTGKTAGFTLPLLERLQKGQKAGAKQVRALILTPTRELAAQVSESVKTYGSDLPLRSAVVFGGVSINPQLRTLGRGVDVLVATPGRLLDLYNQKCVVFTGLEILVLDEADRMLDMGFIHDIRRIINLLPAKRQNLMFSATFSDEIKNLARNFLHNPVEVSVTPRNETAKTVSQCVHPIDKKQKPALLSYLIHENRWGQVLVFTKTKHGANKLAKYLEEAGIKSSAIHGNKSQGARTKALADFKASSIQVLVATDIAARGLDIDQLPQVVNFDLPNVPEDYVHRIGRTGRAGAQGHAVSLVSADEAKLLAAIEKLTGQKIRREEIDGFEPDHTVPEIQETERRSPRPRPNRNNSGGRPGGRNSRNDGGRNTRSDNSRSEGKRPDGKRSENPRSENSRTNRGNPNKPGSNSGNSGSGNPRAKQQERNRSGGSAAGGQRRTGDSAPRSGNPQNRNRSGNR